MIDFGVCAGVGEVVVRAETVFGADRFRNDSIRIATRVE
jgi:hypothetical protein